MLARVSAICSIASEVQGATPASYQLDALLDEGASQEQAYELAARPLLANLLLGGDAALVGIGAAGTGKTHTLFGSPSVLGHLHAAPPEHPTEL